MYLHGIHSDTLTYSAVFRHISTQYREYIRENTVSLLKASIRIP